MGTALTPYVAVQLVILTRVAGFASGLFVEGVHQLGQFAGVLPDPIHDGSDGAAPVAKHPHRLDQVEVTPDLPHTLGQASLDRVDAVVADAEERVAELGRLALEVVKPTL